MKNFDDIYNEEYLIMKQRWDLIDDLNGGIVNMRNSGTKWLPKTAGEKQDNTNTIYNRRLNSTKLIPFYTKSIENLISKPFGQPIILSEDAPKILEDYKWDIDLQGNDLDTFCRKFLKDALDKGLSHILVDYTKVDSDSNVTLSDIERFGLRPYFVHIQANQVVDWDSEFINGREVLTMVRYTFDVWERIEGKKTLVNKFKEIKNDGTYEVWYWNKNKGWELEEEGVLIDKNGQRFNHIPLYTFYTNKTSFMTARPYQEDLAYLQLNHYQVQSDLDNIIHWANTPILFGKNFKNNSYTDDDTTDDNITFGSGSIILGGPDSDIKFVEHTGAAIASGRQNIIDLQDQIIKLSMEPLTTQRSGSITATEIAVSKAEATASLKAIIGLLENTLEASIEGMSYYSNVFEASDISPGVIQINKDFGYSVDDVEHMNVLIQMYQQNVITNKTLLQEAKRRNIIAEDVDIDDEIELSTVDLEIFQNNNINQQNNDNDINNINE